MRLKSRLERLEARHHAEPVSKLWVAYEDTPGHYRLDDGRLLSEAELDALPGYGPGLHGLIICLPEGTA